MALSPRRRTPSTTDLGRALDRYAGTPARPERDHAVEVAEGLLVCESCRRWFPITGLLPELLPDHLRDWSRDHHWLDSFAGVLPQDLVETVRSLRPHAAEGSDDEGLNHKRAEIAIKDKVDDPQFFGPGHSSPFNPHNTQFTLYLIKLFGAAVQLLEQTGGNVVLDSGCGYSWTTEWLYRAGMEVIGVDICRTYLEIGVNRMGSDRPHLVVADVEHLPICSQVIDAVFAYESFHHIPDRHKAMEGFGRALRRGGCVVLAEPGSAHEHSRVARDVMDKYGILEKGMELEDVERYVAGTLLGDPEQLFLLRATQHELGRTLDRTFARTHSMLEGNLFRIQRRDSILEAAAAAWREPRRMVWPQVKRRLKSAFVRLGLE